MNSGRTRECSVNTYSLKEAIRKEYELDETSNGNAKVDSIAINNKPRYFQFKNPTALLFINGQVAYSLRKLAELEKEINFDSLANQTKKAEKWSIDLSDYNMKHMYTHALFNRGILLQENTCVHGLLYVIDIVNVD